MSTLLWITIEMEYKIKCLKFILFFTNGRQKFDPERVKERRKKFVVISFQLKRNDSAPPWYQSDWLWLKFVLVGVLGVKSQLL